MTTKTQKSPLLIVLLINFVLVSSCTQKTFESEEALWHYLRDFDNGYVHQKNVNGIDFSLVQRPTDLLVKQELGDDIDAKKVRQLREKYSKYLYFNLSMSKNNQELLSTVPKNRNEFGAMVHQLAFGMHERVHLYTQKKDTIELVDYIYPRMYGMSRSTTMLFVYPREEEKLREDHLYFTIEDIGLFTGEIKFKIPVKKIRNEPKLKFK